MHILLCLPNTPLAWEVCACFAYMLQTLLPTTFPLYVHCTYWNYNICFAVTDCISSSGWCSLLTLLLVPDYVLLLCRVRLPSKVATARSGTFPSKTW
ncbi:hypothetical protein EDD17DRAFT_1573911 [Pisolithus thermaeus]|nr:hypothetical protein EDD17DRAFT_1573911 [Pisolithus thermaeus]